ncbi:MAG: RtcB family protein, partial [Chlamydiia bacterium]|nr:RtcB family protein [Chlamydiia bacterium]
MSDQGKWIAEGLLQLPRVGGMLVPGLVVANKELLKEVEMTRAFEQVRNVAHLQGIVGQSIAMPDIHWGYGFPIGGVAATDVETGVISPGGVGYDINCGVRLALAPIALDSLAEKMREKLLEGLFRAIPSGIGAGKSERESLKESDYRSLLVEGARWSVRKGFGVEADLQSCENHGKIANADPAAVSTKAKERGSCQLGSIGSGNHFVEIGDVEEI